MYFYIIVIIVLIYFWLKKKFSYWEERGVPSVPGKLPLGSVNGLGSKFHTSVLFKRFYDEHKGKGPGVGFYMMTQPAFLLTEPDLVKDVLVRNFDTFHHRGIYMNEKIDPLSENLFFLKGQQWRDLRNKLTPTFTSGKIKMMFETISKVGDRMVDYLEPSANKSQEIEMKNILESFTTEVISNVAFGLETQCIGNSDNEFRKVANMLLKPPKYMMAKFIFMNNFPSLSAKLGLRAHMKEVTEYFIKVIKTNIEYRETNNIERKDFLQLLIQIKNSEAGMTLNQIAANCFIFLLAGTETSASVASFTLYELALDQDIQDKLRNEIEEVLLKHNDKINYDAIMEMKYLDMVFNESLRKYPIVDTQVRTCCKEFKIPNSDITIPEGTVMVISANGLHNDERFFEDPNKFDPERFSDENIRNHNPFAYIPFSKLNLKTL